MQACTFNWDTHKIWVQRITFNHNSSLVPVSLHPYIHLHKSHQNSHFNHNRHKKPYTWMFCGKLLSHKVWSARVLCFQKWSIGVMFSYPVSVPLMTAALSCRDGSFVFPTERERDGVMQCLMLVLELPLKLSCIITPVSLRRTWLMNCYCLSLHTNFSLKIDPDRIPETRRGRKICDVHQVVMRYKVL